jgi:hypothetical protein
MGLFCFYAILTKAFIFYNRPVSRKFLSYHLQPDQAKHKQLHSEPFLAQRSHF